MDTQSGSLVGTQLGRYRIEAKLGAGGMGEVFRALDVDLHRPVALKTLRPEIALDSANVERFFAEARAANVIRHEHIVEYTDMHKAGPGGTSYVVMELLEGRTLTRAIRDRGRLAPERAVFIAAQVADALEAAHHAGIVHRDLKPDNVFLIRRMGTDDYVKVLDFGVARLRPEISGLGAQATQTGMIIGTPAYMSPEQCKGEKAMPAADIYALGVILFQMLTGQLPFDGATAPMMLVAHMLNEPPSVHALAPDVPVALSMLVAQALAKQPEQRLPSMAAMRDAMLAAVGMEAFGPALTADMPVSRTGAAPVWAQGTPQARAAGAPGPGATLPARGQAPGPDATALQRPEQQRPAAATPPGDPTVRGRPAAPRPSRPMQAQEPPPAQPDQRAGEPVLGHFLDQFPGQAPAQSPGRAPERASAPYPEPAQAGLFAGLIDDVEKGAAGRASEPSAQSLPEGLFDGLEEPPPGRPSRKPAGRLDHQPRATNQPAPSIAGGSMFDAYGSVSAPATTHHRDHPRPVTPAPTLAAPPKARVPDHDADFPAVDRSRRRRVVLAATALLACATAGVLWGVYGRSDTGQAALAPDAGSGARPEDATAGQVAELRRRLDALAAAHEEPGAPAACQTRDAALLDRLVRAATLLQGGAPDGRREQDIEAVRLLSDPPPGSAEHWYWLAKARLYADANAGAASEAASRAIASCEGYAAAHNAVGSALFRDRPAEAAAAYREAVALAPGFARARFNLGLIHLQHGEPGEGLASLTAVIDGSETSASLRAEALRTRGHLHLLAKESDRAVADLERAVAAAPADAQALFLLGQAHALAGRDDAAREAMCKAHALGHAPAAEHCPQ
jgi:tetratricopeptide (TPR) repeat protein